MQDGQRIYFSLASDIYAAPYAESIIILDIARDKYISLIDGAAKYLSYLISHQFLKKDSSYLSIEDASTSNLDSVELTYWITYFFEKKYIVESFVPAPKSIGSYPLEVGGLINYDWNLKVTKNPFSQVSIISALKATWALHKIYRAIKKGGIKKVVQLLRSVDTKALYVPNEKEIGQLSALVDAALMLYPKKNYCLGWAATFVLLALERGWQAQLVVGIQVNPFYAHAWAEIAGRVVNDEQRVAQVLSIILRTPSN